MCLWVNILGRVNIFGSDNIVTIDDHKMKQEEEDEHFDEEKKHRSSWV